MGDGGCAVLSSRHPLAEFRNSEHCHREQLRNTWDTEFGLVTVKESAANVSVYHEERFTWTCIGDMEPGSDFQVSDDVGEATRSENSRLNERVCEITNEGPAPESTSTTGPIIINNESKEKAHHDSPQQVTEEKSGTLASESEQFSSDNASVKVVDGGLGDDDQSSHAKNQCRVEDTSVGLDNSYLGDQLHLESNPSVGDNESSCSQSRQEHNLDNASLSKPLLPVGPKSGATGIPTHKEHGHSHSERILRSDKVDRLSEQSTIDHRRGATHSHHGRSESLARSREHSLGKREVKEKKTGDHDPNYNSPRHKEHTANYDNHGFKKEYKDKRNDHESSHCSSRPGYKGKENGDGFGRGNPATNSRGPRDLYADKDSHNNRVYHKRSHDNKSSSTQEECHKISNDSVKRSTKNDQPSCGKQHRDEVVSFADRNGFHGSPAEKKNICDKVSVDPKEQILKLESKLSDAEAETYPTHQSNVSVNLQKDGLLPEEMDVPMDMSPEPMDLSPEPMDLSPAPAEDNKPSSSAVWVAQELSVKKDSEGWVYLDAYGVMQGPMPLDILKSMMVLGKLQSDHMVQLVGSNEWFTLEHAGLALSILDLKPSKINRISGNAEVIQEASTGETIKFEDEDFITGGPNHDLEIDERVEQIMKGFTLVPGKEKEVVVEALIKAAGSQQELNEEESLPVNIGPASYWNENQLEVTEGYDRTNSSESNEAVERVSGINQLTNFRGIFQSSRNWTARGGDWKLTQNVENNENARNATHSMRPEKTVLNRGIPLCQKCQPNLIDPRIGSQLYDAPVSRTLELPIWAYRYWDVKGESLHATTENGNAAPTPPIPKVTTPRGLNADGSKKHKVTKVTPQSEQKSENAGENAPDFSGYAPANSLGGISEKDVSYEAFSQNLTYQEIDIPNMQSADTELSLPVENEVIGDLQKMVHKVPTKDDLRLDTGDWFYRDGTGQEIGPFTYRELQVKSETGLLYAGASVYRKSDQTWVPVVLDKNSVVASSVELVEQASNENKNELQIFHDIYPQFIGYMCGKLHEHVMKSYKTRDFSAMLSSFGDRKSRRVGTGDHTSHAHLEASSRQNDRSPSNLDANPEMDFIENSVPRTRGLLDIDGKRVEENTSWGFLSPRLLVRVFRFLETDIKSIVLASATCRTWRAASVQFKREITQLDLSPLGRLCSDDMFRSFTEHASNVSRIILRGCTTLSLSVVKTFLESLHSVESIDIKGCNQLKELQLSFTKYQSGKSTKLFLDRKNMSASKQTKPLDAAPIDDWKARRLSFSSMHSDGATEAMDCDTPHSSQRNSDISRSSDSSKRFKMQSSAKVLRPNADSSNSKVMGSYARDSEYKQKQNVLLSSANEVDTQSWIKGDYSSGPDKKLEKDMAFVLQCLKDAKIPDSRKLSSSGSSGSRALAYREIEDKLRRGLYPPNMQGFRAFKGDLLSVARMLFRGKDKQAGMVVFGNTFRLTSQLEEEFKCRDMSLSKPHKRKYQDYKSSSISPGKRRRIVSGPMNQQFDRKRISYDDSTDDEEHDFDLTYKSDTSATDEEDVSSQCDEDSVSDSDTDSDESDSEVESESDKEDKIVEEKEPLSEDETDSRIWGARMTKASMVPPVTRKYELIEEYVIVADEEEVRKRMEVQLPDDYEKIVRAQEDNGIEFSHLIMPELREYRPRKRVQDEVLEQEVYGIDPYTHNLLIDSMPTNRTDFSDEKKHDIIEEDILKALNLEVRQYTGTVKAPTKYPLELVVNRAFEDCKDFGKRTFISGLAKNMRARRESNMRDNYVAYRKGLGVVCNDPCGFAKDEFIVEFFGEVYPAWRWFEKQDAIRAFQKKDKEGAPEFYNIFLERPKGDANGYDLVVVDAMHKANYASRICHSCNPNCEARVTAVNGKYQIGVYTLRNVEYGEELTFDYNSITESKEEHETSVCLCGSHICRGSYLNFAGPDTFQEIMKADHGVLHRHELLLHACTTGAATSEDWDVLKQACLGSCLLGGLPEWTVKYAAGVMRFLNEERQSLPREILKTILSERTLDKPGEQEAFEAEVQADGVFNTRLQNLAITLDKVRYVLKTLYGDPKAAPPPLRKLEPVEVIRMLWTDDNSIVAALLNGMSPHISREAMSEFRRKVQEHEPSQRGDLMYNLQKSLLWLRDELCKAPIACVTRHDAAADLIHMYAHTKLFFTRQDYETFDSPSLRISPLDLGPKHAHKLGGAPYKEWTKTYSKDYVLGQLIFWYKLNESEPGSSLAKASRGCVVLPDPSSCYSKSMQHRLVYGSVDRLKMFRRMEHKPQRPWNWKGQYFWEFNHDRKLLGSPMMDAVHEGTNVNKEMMDWLKRRTRAFEGQWDIE